VTIIGPLASPPPPAGGVDLDLPGDGVRLRATRWPGNGSAVLLLHGLASTRHIWRRVVPELLAAPMPPAVVAVDQRGHGDSGRPDGPYDGQAVVADLLTALDALALSRVVVVGHSWGATTAVRLAASAPGRVLACVALDGGTGAFAGTGEDRARLRERLTPPRLAESPEALRRLLADGPLAPWWSPEIALVKETLFEVAADGRARARLPFDAHMAVLDDLLDTDHDALWAQVSCPAWVVACQPVGEVADPWTGAKDAALARLHSLPHPPRVLRWAGAVHDVPLQWPALVAGLVRTACDDTVRLVPGGEGRSA